MLGRKVAAMYLPKHFVQHDETEIRRFIAATRVADLVTSTADGLEASIVPFVAVDGGRHGALHGHLARANDQWRGADGTDALAIFRGPDAYVTPRWYPAKAEHGRVVPTWNYAVVHVHGRLVVHDDAAWTRVLVTRLTDEMEAASDAPWSVDDAPADYIERQLKAIVGIELQISRIEAKWKLSQNQPEREAAGVVEGMASLADPDAQRIVAMMRDAASR
jgi:transcriptional regulator